MAGAIYRHGKPLMIDHVAEEDITAGDMLVINSTAGWVLGIAHVDFKAGDKGALAAGGGVYHCEVAGAYDKGAKLYKADGTDVLTTTATSNALFGFAAEDSAGAGAIIEVIHEPYV